MSPPYRPDGILALDARDEGYRMVADVSGSLIFFKDWYFLLFIACRMPL